MSRQISSCFATVSIDDLSYIPPEHASDGAESTIAYAATGRKTWKRLRQDEEAVWPPLIEAALLKGLERYRPTTSREPKYLQRFPMRNKFISEYILKHTGKKRTPKQVGSRLQQLRDTCSDPRVLDLLMHPSMTFNDLSNSSSLLKIKKKTSRSFKVLPASYLESPASLPSEVAELPEEMGLLDELQYPVPILQNQLGVKSIEVGLVDTAPSTCSSMETDNFGQVVNFFLDGNLSRGATTTCDKPSPKEVHLEVNLSGNFADSIPVVTFTSSRPLPHTDYRSFFSVISDEKCIASEVTELVELSTPTSPKHDAQYVYGIMFFPNYWSSLALSTDLSTVRVVQIISRVLSPQDDVLTTLSIYDATLLSIVYQFNYIENTPAATLLGQPSFPDDLQFAGLPEVSISGLDDYPCGDSDVSITAYQPSWLDHGCQWNTNWIVPEPSWFNPLTYHEGNEIAPIQGN